MKPFYQGLEPSYNQPFFDFCAEWNLDATTLATYASTNAPTGIFIDRNNTIYAAIRDPSRIEVWYGGNIFAFQNASAGSSNINAVFVTSNGDIYVDQSDNSASVQKRTSVSGSATIVMQTNVNGSCMGLFVDLSDDIYCSMLDSHRVLRKASNASANQTTMVAGDGTAGSASHQLNAPRGIFVDSNYTLYVADGGNNRIQRFFHNQLNGTTIVGFGAPGTITLSSPGAVILDGNGYLFISDNQNNRIVASGPFGFRWMHRNDRFSSKSTY
jgi:hypothetical protein